jgi:hypothetical protein
MSTKSPSYDYADERKIYHEFFKKYATEYRDIEEYLENAKLRGMTLPDNLKKFDGVVVCMVGEEYPTSKQLIPVGCGLILPTDQVKYPTLKAFIAVPTGIVNVAASSNKEQHVWVTMTDDFEEDGISTQTDLEDWVPMNIDNVSFHPIFEPTLH